MKKQKIIIPFILILLFLPLMQVPQASAVPVYLASNGLTYAAGYGEQYNNWANLSQTFEALTNGYLDSVTITVFSFDDTAGDDHTSAYFRCGVYTLDGSSKPNTATGLIEYSDDVFLFTSPSETTNYHTMSFAFDDLELLSSGTGYAVVLSITYVYTVFGQDYFGLASSSGGISTGQPYHLDTGVWAAADPAGYDATVFYVFGQDAPAATPTPTPEPTPFVYQGDIWAALVPYANILLPLVLIIFVALLCGKYGGVWGFFAGLNVAVILVYAIMGASYMPLWGLVMLALVDGLLLFGKISGRM